MSASLSKELVFLILQFLDEEKFSSQILRETVIPEAPMFKLEFPPQEPEIDVLGLEEDGKSEEQVELGLKCLSPYKASTRWTGDSTPSFRYWKISDNAYDYRSGVANPSMVGSAEPESYEDMWDLTPDIEMLQELPAATHWRQPWQASL